MGFRTVAVLNNDRLHEFKERADAGKLISSASAYYRCNDSDPKWTDFGYGHVCSVEHADTVEVIVIKNGRGHSTFNKTHDKFLMEKNQWDSSSVVDVMKEFLERNGYKVIRKRKKDEKV